MKYGFVKTAAVSPKIRVADTEYNAQETIRLMREAWEKGARIIVFPELGITGYTCSDLFLPGDSAGKSAREELLQEIVAASKGMDGLILCGSSTGSKDGKLYNVAAALLLTDICWDWCRRHIFPTTVSSMRLRHFTPGNAAVGCTSGYMSRMRTETVSLWNRSAVYL